MTLKIKITEGPIQVNNKYMIIDKNTGEVLQLDFEKPKPVIVLNEEQGQAFLNERFKNNKENLKIIPTNIAVFDNGIAEIVAVMRTIKVVATYEFLFDAEGYDPEHIDIAGLAVDSAMRDLKHELSNNTLDVGDFKFTITEDSDNLLDLNKINNDEKEN